MRGGIAVSVGLGLVLFGLAAFGVAGPAAAETLTIKEYTRDPMGLYDAAGNRVSAVPAKKLPKLPFAAETLVPGGRPKVMVDGAEYYLRRADIDFDGGSPMCAELAQVQRSASATVASASVGIASNAAQNAATCVKRP